LKGNSMTDNRRLIEVNLPLVAISDKSARDKYPRKGHISAVHVWWARRPLPACRATVSATLLKAPNKSEEQNRLQDLIAEALGWDHIADGSSPRIAEVEAAISTQFNGVAPKVLDPFAGGGAIPLEAQRLGCEAHAVELNPVAHLIEFCTLVYPQKYADGVPGPAQPREGEPCEGLEPSQGLEGEQLRMEGLDQPAGERTLADDVERWGKWVLEQARAEIGEFYENPVGDDTIVTYLWARTVECPNPSCGATMPLVKQLWLRRKSGKTKVALKPVVERGRGAGGQGSKGAVRFEVVCGDEIPDDFDPSEGTSSRGSATCLVCGQTVEADYVRGEGGRSDGADAAGCGHHGRLW
jgi:adenine-specific DNA methylase